MKERLKLPSRFGRAHETWIAAKNDCVLFEPRKLSITDSADTWMLLATGTTEISYVEIV